MDKTLHQPSMPARPLQRCRIKLGPACIALLLALLVTSLGLVARTAIQGQPLTRTQDDVIPVAGDYLLGTQVSSPAGSLKEILAHPDLIPTHDHPLLGRQAPDFQLADPDGKAWNLRELQAGGPVVLIFYHGYHCKNCVRQFFDVRRDLPLFREVDAHVVAISADPPELTRRRIEQYGPFGFPVLSDPGNKVAQAYQVSKPAQDGKNADLILRHGTFVIDRVDTIRWVNVGDAPLRRSPALLSQLAKMEGRLPSVQPGP